MPQTTHIECPICHAKSDLTIESSINVETHPQLKDQLLSGELLAFECETCGAKRQVETQIMYHDPKKKLLIYLAPNYHDHQAQIIQGLNQMTVEEGIDIHDYQLRIVSSTPQLIEKITIFDAGLDDQTMEVVKLLTDGLFAQQEPERQIINRFFIKRDDAFKFLYITDSDQLFVDYHPTLTEFIQDKFAKELQASYLGQFIVVDQNWATNIANHLPGPGVQVESDA